MSASKNSGLRIAVVILHALVAGSVTAAVVVIAPILAGFLIGWLVRLLGWRHAGDSIMVIGLWFITLTGFLGLAFGLVVSGSGPRASEMRERRECRTQLSLS
jgi:hypothetical protein